MNHLPARIVLPLAAMVLLLASLACGLGQVSQSQQPAWTPAPVVVTTRQAEAPAEAAAAATSTTGGNSLATVAIPLATDVPAPTAIATVPAAAAPLAGAATPTGGSSAGAASASGLRPALPAPAPTLDPHIVVITEDDIASAIANGAGEGSGAQVENLNVRFTGGKTYITASSASYSFINVQNLSIVGRLVAEDGALQMETESVSPQNLVTSMIPGLINQALRQRTSQWYVESVQTLERRIELRIR